MTKAFNLPSQDSFAFTFETVIIIEISVIYRMMEIFELTFLDYTLLAIYVPCGENLKMSGFKLVTSLGFLKQVSGN